MLHSHYADAGYVGVRLSHLTGIPLVHTGHSLGRDKVRRLLAMGLTVDEIEHRYRMSERIKAEEDVLNSASLVITSTHNEIEDQYELYDCYTPEKMSVIPPGTDLNQFHPPAADDAPTPFANTLAKYLREPDRPMILALSRPDERKNIVSLLEAYGQCERLQQLANLVIIAGNRNDIRELNEGAQHVLTELLLVIDCYELNGLVALPKHHAANEVADIYRLAAASKGVFVNPALTEPFGLTLLEAAASGLPLVATEVGGPVDIIGNCKNGLLVDPLDEKAISGALLDILEDSELWSKFSRNGLINVASFYSWEAHAKTYLEKLKDLIHQARMTARPAPMARVPAVQTRTRAIFTAIDNTLLGDAEALARFVKVMREHHRKVLFGISTGRRIDSVLKILKTPCHSDAGYPDHEPRHGDLLPTAADQGCFLEPSHRPLVDADGSQANHRSPPWPHSPAQGRAEPLQDLLLLRRESGPFDGGDSHAAASAGDSPFIQCSPSDNSWISCPPGPPRARRCGMLQTSGRFLWSMFS